MVEYRLPMHAASTKVVYIHIYILCSRSIVNYCQDNVTTKAVPDCYLMLHLTYITLFFVPQGTVSIRTISTPWTWRASITRLANGTCGAAVSTRAGFAVNAIKAGRSSRSFHRVEHVVCLGIDILYRQADSINLCVKCIFKQRCCCIQSVNGNVLSGSFLLIELDGADIYKMNE